MEADDPLPGISYPIIDSLSIKGSIIPCPAPALVKELQLSCLKLIRSTADPKKQIEILEEGQDPYYEKGSAAQDLLKKCIQKLRTRLTIGAAPSEEYCYKCS